MLLLRFECRVKVKLTISQTLLIVIRRYVLTYLSYRNLYKPVRNRIVVVVVSNDLMYF